ncbi:MAG: DinB family protein [Bacteroidota bacterium]
MEAFLKRLDAQIRRLKGNIHAIPEAELQHKPAPEKWSKKEILGHLIDSARYNLNRFSETPFAASPYQAQPYNQDHQVAINRYQEADTEHLIALWQGLNRQICTLVQALTPAQLALPLVTPGGEHRTLRWLIEDYAEHLEHHLNQILTPDEAVFPFQITLENARAILQEKAPAEFVPLLEIGDLQIEYYQPNVIDRQKPHIQDEIYVIISGEGDFVREQDTCRFKPHDVLFVKAGEEHRFVNFTTDFACWVVFYGLKR